MEICNNFKIRFDAFKVEHAEMIDRLAGTIDLHTKTDEFAEFHYDMANDLKGHLATDAANNCSDDVQEQDEAIAGAESWVTDNISNGASTEDTVALALWAHGLQVGEQVLAQYAATPACIPSPRA